MPCCFKCGSRAEGVAAITADVIIRTIGPGGLTAQDLAATADIYFRAVRQGTQDHYTERQRAAWAPQTSDPAVWADRLNGQTVFIAESAGDIVGFVSLRPDRNVDFCFVDPAWHRLGIGHRLLAALEKRARKDCLTILSADVSLAADRLFLGQGWIMVKEQSVTTNGVNLTNFRMEKTIDAA